MKRSLHYLAILLIVALVGMWGCPKKTEVSSTPETPTTAETVKQAPAPAEPSEADKAAAAERARREAAERERAAAAAAEGLKPVYFDYDRSSVRDDQRNVMAANAAWLKSHPKAKIRIEGNCDERGTREYNQALGQRRAASAKKYLTTLGVSASRLALISYGKEKQVCSDSTESCWQKNRKDDFIVTSD